MSFIEQPDRSRSVFVAASNATAREKAVADFICDGTADEVQIILAIDAMIGTNWDDNKGGGAGAVDHVPEAVNSYSSSFYRQTRRGTVILSSGDFEIAASIPLVFRLNFEGQGILATRPYLVASASDVKMFSYATNRHASDTVRTWGGISKMYLDGNEANSATGKAIVCGTATQYSDFLDLKLKELGVFNFNCFNESGDPGNESGVSAAAIAANEGWGWVVDDVTIEFNTGHGFAIWKDTVNGSSAPKFSNCKFMDNSKSGLVVELGNPYIVNSEFSACEGAEGDYTNKYAGVVLGANAGFARITNCNFTIGNDFTYGLRITDAANCVVMGNTFDLGSDKTGVRLDYASQPVQNDIIANNTFAGAGTGISVHVSASYSSTALRDNAFRSTVVTPIDDSKGYCQISGNSGYDVDFDLSTMADGVSFQRSGSEVVFSLLLNGANDLDFADGSDRGVNVILCGLRNGKYNLIASSLNITDSDSVNMADPGADADYNAAVGTTAVGATDATPSGTEANIVTSTDVPIGTSQVADTQVITQSTLTTSSSSIFLNVGVLDTQLTGAGTIALKGNVRLNITRAK